MTVPSLGKFLLPATLTAGAVFSVLAAPVALLGSESVNVQFQGETFDGKIKDIATPYLGLAGVLSLGAGVASIALTGWRQSAQQSNKTEQQLLEVQRQLKEREVQLQSNFLSDKHLNESGLSFFLENEVQHQAAIAQPIIQTNAPVMQPTAIAVNSAASRTAIPQMSAQSTVSPLSAAQAFLGFSRSSASAPVQAPSQSTPPQGKAAIAQIEQIGELQNQLQQILFQIEALQGDLMATPQLAATPVPRAEDLSMIPQLEQRLKNLEAQWVMQRVAS